MAKLLIVADEPVLTRALHAALDGSPHDTRYVPDAQAALSTAGAQACDLVIASVDGAGQAGFDLCSALRLDPDTHDLPIILLTTQAEPAVLVRALLCGADSILTAPFSPAHLMSRVDAALAPGAGLPGASALRKDGVDADLLASSRPPQQLARFLASVLQDLAHAKRELRQSQAQEARLKESEERYRQLVEGSVQGIMIVQRGDIVHCNAACARMFGYASTAEMTGMPAINVVHSEDRHEALRTGSAEMRTGNPRLLRYYRGVRKDGSQLWYEPNRDDIQWMGRRAVMWTLNDVTEARTLRLQLETAQRMESIGRLAGGIAHDFNNILSVITSYGDIVRTRYGLTGKCLEDLGTINDAAHRATALTRQLLAFSRRQVMKMEPINVNETVSGMGPMLQRLIGENISLHVKLPPDLHTVRADRSQLEQIVMNMAVNARDAMPNGGTLTIETRNEYLDEEYAATHYGSMAGTHVLLAISDTGIGMDEATRTRIFEPFFTTKASGKGTGLGLATVFGIVQQMGGSIWVYSEPGRGTAFKIYLPGHPDLPAVAERAAEADAGHLGGSETILVIEDDQQVRAVTLRILSERGYRVLEAADGATALDILRAQAGRVDLILSDVVMPGMSAGELLDALRAIPGAMIPLVFMSGYTDNSVVNHGIQEGELPFLHKPFTQNSLLSKVRDVLNQGGAAGSDRPSP